MDVVVVLACGSGVEMTSAGVLSVSCHLEVVSMNVVRIEEGEVYFSLR